ncbi:uncharacterized protein LOC110978123 isoform X2 [Acanthaster planci]|uniref:Uncharacterized protein LOC110978123 isoform X2 n=1 Tax=Acanthaster planci TaxID=133434 RepID=A0A8B7YA28_ACAPL|nr:uncharacterized protein LOC110978123 isoform X2 [Acanthaster planci]
MDTLFFQNKHGSNPFEDEPLPVAHYHPSLQKQLTEAEKKVNLSPDRLLKHDVIGPSSLALQGKDKPLEKPSPAEREFLGRANTLLAKELPTHDTPSPGNASSKFDESWPTSERPSTIESPGEYRPPRSVMTTDPTRPAHGDLGATMVTKLPGSSSSASGTDYLAQWRNRYNKQHQNQPHQNRPAEGSTLAKYIQRFRYSEPRSRQEREKEKQRAGGGSDFWWLALPSRTSTPSDEDGRTPPRLAAPGVGNRQRGRGGVVRPLGRREAAGSNRMSSSSASPSDRVDTDTEDLQTRADRLLERSESTILSEPSVSSDGVGISSTPSSHQEPDYTVRDVPRPLKPAASFHMPPSAEAGHPLGKTPGLRPEDDILHQWRVRRRLEEARRQAAGREKWSNASRGANLGKPTPGGASLDDFRRRLKQHELLTQSRPGTLRTQLSEPLTKTTGTSPMPQTTATQTNGVLLSVGEDVLVRDSIMRNTIVAKKSDDGPCREPVMPASSHVHALQDISAGPEEAISYQSGDKFRDHPTPLRTVPGEPGHDRIAEPIIASPNVRPTASSIVPHLHMACDIIPCPEDQKPDDRSHRNIDSRGSDLVSGERIRSSRVRDAQDLSATGAVTASVTRPQASLHPAPLREVLPNRDDTAAHQKHLQERTAHSRNMSEHLSVTKTSQPTKPRTSVREGDDHKIPERRQETKDDFPRQSLDFEEDSRRDRRQTPGSADDEIEEETEEEIRDGGMTGPPLRGQERGPFRSSSPIGTAVGQVISDRLFGTPGHTTVSTPKSSIDSLPSMHSSLRSHTSESFTPPQDGGNRAKKARWRGTVKGGNIRHKGRPDREEVTSSASSSDREEFAEDELLQLLRRRRAQYENQLQTLDRLIEMQSAGT